MNSGSGWQHNIILSAAAVVAALIAIPYGLAVAYLMLSMAGLLRWRHNPLARPQRSGATYRCCKAVENASNVNHLLYKLIPGEKRAAGRPHVQCTSHPGS